MEAELLATLKEIKVAVYLLLGFVVLGVIANWIRTGVSIKNVVRRELNDLFTEEASNLYDEGKLKELLVHCDERLKNKPNHSYALWYKAKAHFGRKEYGEAKELFERLATSEPSWNESHVQPCLAKIDAASERNF